MGNMGVNPATAARHNRAPAQTHQQISFLTDPIEDPLSEPARVGSNFFAAVRNVLLIDAGLALLGLVLWRLA